MTWGKIYYVSSKALHNTSTLYVCTQIDWIFLFCKYLQIFDLLVLNTKLFLEFCLPTFVISQILFILYKRCKQYKKGGLTTRGHSLTMLTRPGGSQVKFSFSEWATKICAIVLMVLTFTKGASMYYVIVFWRFFDPPCHQIKRKHLA